MWTSFTKNIVLVKPLWHVSFHSTSFHSKITCQIFSANAMTSGDFCSGILHLFFSVHYMSDLVYFADEGKWGGFYFWLRTDPIFGQMENLQNLGQLPRRLRSSKNWWKAQSVSCPVSDAAVVPPCSCGQQFRYFSEAQVPSSASLSWYVLKDILNFLSLPFPCSAIHLFANCMLLWNTSNKVIYLYLWCNHLRFIMDLPYDQREKNLCRAWPQVVLLKYSTFASHSERGWDLPCIFL